MGNQRKKRKKSPSAPPAEQNFSGLFRRRKNKVDWAGIHMGYAFDSNMDYYVRIPAQRLFYRAARKIQMAAARQAGMAEEDKFTPHTSVQLAPFYTAYPSVPAAFASIGITGFLEFQDRVPERLLLTHLNDYLSNPSQKDEVDVDAKAYRRIAGIVAGDVQTRILLEDLSRNPSMKAVEIYRLFSACQQTMRFRTVQEMIHCVVLYGDVLPCWDLEKLHPVTRAILRDLTEVSEPFFDALTAADGLDLLEVGDQWVKVVCRRLSRYLPAGTCVYQEPGSGNSSQSPGVSGHQLNQGDPKPESDGDKPRFRPLDEPDAPSLFDAPTLDQNLLQQFDEAAFPAKASITNMPEGSSQLVQKTLNRFAEILQQACMQESDYEDMRSDLVELALRDAPFSETPITGTPSEGQEVEVRLGNERAEVGEIFDRTVELSEDLPALQWILSESQPLTNALKRTLYPNLEEIPERQRFRSSGMLDSSRLPLAAFSGSVFQRYRVLERADPRGRPVLLLACDGSGSLNREEMKMTRILATAWLRSTANRNLQILAGLYHSGSIRQGVTGPLVQWIYHPHKTPSIHRTDAVRAVVSLPDSGTGVQSDAISLAYMLNEARKLAKQRMIYLILITDCEWNRCFPDSKSGEEEMTAFFGNLYANSQMNLHTTMVAFGEDRKSAVENLVDKVIRVRETQLRDPIAVAVEIGTYVAECIRERRRIIKQTG